VAAELAPCRAQHLFAGQETDMAVKAYELAGGCFDEFFAEPEPMRGVFAMDTGTHDIKHPPL